MTYTAKYKNQTLTSDQSYLTNSQGTGSSSIFTDFLPIESETLNTSGLDYEDKYYFLEIELGEHAISSTISQTRGVGRLNTTRIVYTGEFNYDNNGNFSSGSISEINFGNQSEIYRLKFIGEDLYPGQRPIRIHSLDDLDKNFNEDYKYGKTGAEEEFFPGGLDWHNHPWGDNIIKASGKASKDSGSNSSKNIISLVKPQKFNKKLADKITNFNPSIDVLQIDTDSFGIDISAAFAAGKNKKIVKKRLAKQDFDFLYDEKRGGLYFNENGSDTGFGDGGIIAIIKGDRDLTASSLKFI